MSAPRITVPPPHPATLSEEALWKQVKFDRVRGSGPGGQRRNKVETGVELEHVPTGLRAIATERRSPEENRTRALFRLRLRLAVEVRVEPTEGVSGGLRNHRGAWPRRRFGNRGFARGGSCAIRRIMISRPCWPKLSTPSFATDAMSNSRPVGWDARPRSW